MNINPRKEIFHNYSSSVYTASKYRVMKQNTYRNMGALKHFFFVVVARLCLKYFVPGHEVKQLPTNHPQSTRFFSYFYWGKESYTKNNIVKQQQQQQQHQHVSRIIKSVKKSNYGRLTTFFCQFVSEIVCPDD